VDQEEALIVQRKIPLRLPFRQAQGQAFTKGDDVIIDV
jgi:hypothetical protein